MIATLKELCPSLNTTALEIPVHTGYFLIGCSATNYRGKLVASAWASDHFYSTERARYENYTGNPHGLEGDPRSHRPPYLVWLNDDLTPLSWHPIPTPPQFQPGGFDGLKPYEFKGDLYCDFYTGGIGRVQFYQGMFYRSTLQSIWRMSAPGPRRDEKNWMPEIHNGELRYHYDVCTLATPRPAADLWNPAELRDMGRPDFKNLHGGTQVVHGLAIVHDFHYVGNGRAYRHYFVRFNQYGEPFALSRPFVLFNFEKVEVVTGLAIHPDGKSLVISEGIRLSTVDLAEVWHMPWDGVPQPAPPSRPAPPSPLRSPQVKAPVARRAGTGVRA